MNPRRVPLASIAFASVALATLAVASQKDGARVPVPPPAAATVQGATSGGPYGLATAALYCPDSLRDQTNPTACIQASSTPVVGALFPLGVELNVDPQGRVGIGTLSPQSQLHIAGDLTVEGGVSIGNNSGSANGEVIFDLSERITDFGGSAQWQVRYSNIVIDPTIDLTGPDEKYLFGSTEVTQVPSTNSSNLRYLVGSYHAAATLGSGNVEFMAGSGHTASALGSSSMDQQVGAFVASDARESSSVQDNRGLQIGSGHAGTAGQIVANHGIYLESPKAVQPLQHHYGIFIEDQDFGQNDSFAVYSEGGTVYLAGDVGIGTNAPGYKLQVGEPGDGSEARANAWNLLSSRHHKRDIRPLSAEERAEVLESIVATDVVRYAYKDDPDGEEHLGVIAEDSPEGFLSKDRRAVSLGDWSAHLMAALQAQQSEIDDLRRELDALRATLEDVRVR